MSEPNLYIYMIRLVKPESVERMSRQEEAIIDEHFKYLKKALADKKLTLAGRCLGEEFGIVIFKAETETQAEDLMRNDPAVKNGVMTAELHPFSIALIDRS